METILDMADGGIIDIDYEQEHYSGCHTCDYGSSYINDITIRMTKLIIKIYTDTMYEYAFNEGDLMKIVLKNINEIIAMTEIEFANWLRGKLKEITSRDIEYSVKPL